MNGAILTNRSSDKRSKSDYYPTPCECTQALIDFMRFDKSTVVCEPACGNGHISMVFENNGYKVISTDINHYGFESETEDFLASNGKQCDWIITNPPFSLSEQFVKKCLELKKPFALLLKSQYWHSKKRLSLFLEHKPMFVLPMTWRPDFEFGKKGGAPTMDCIWTVWDICPAKYTTYIPLKKPEQEAKKEEAE